MRKLLLLIPLWLLVAQVLHAQCPQFSNFLNTQAKVDDFVADYSNCPNIPASLTIFGSGITDISGLSFINSVGGDFQIKSTTLQNLSGLENLISTTGSLILSDNTNLEDLSDLEGVTTVGGTLTSQNNPKLESLDGLENLTTINGLVIQDNSTLKDLDALANLTYVGQQIIIRNNSTLTDIDGLANLTTIVGPSVAIQQNPQLSSCSIESFCNELENPDGVNFNINANKDGCNSVAQIEFICNPLQAVCKDATVALQGDGSASINANAVDDGSIGVTSSSVSPSSFSCSDLGDNTVTLTVSDGNGDTDECTATVTVILPNDLPSPWTATDIGDPGSGNSYNFDPCVAGPAEYTISADGYHLIPNTSDNMAFASLPLCGNGGIQARIESVEGGYAGLMIRESSAPGARMIGIYSNLTSLLRREVRYTDNGQNESNTTYASFPSMLRLVRNGDRINGFYKNGSKWIKFHQAELPMGDCVEMGLVVFSTNPFGTATATFDKVNFMSGMNLSAPNTGPIADALSDVQRARVSPNPTSGAFTLDFEQPLELEATAILLNELGQPLRQLQLPAGAINHSFDDSNLPRGLYFLEVRDEQGYREVLKVVRQ
ncbi:T9SS type A sorting domain-containing protein [Phaeodactylibacter xiamenensis]|uniref:T9SS type A sorting domain-containing protein n=1 Tax=Phaeodactylibacter xiamenensis TaxID=1524460 RepID=UPI003CCBDD58